MQLQPARLLVAVLLALSCAPPPETVSAPPPPPAPSVRPSPRAISAPTATTTPTASPVPTGTPTTTATPYPTPTPHPLGWATVEGLRARGYGGEGIEVLQLLGAGPGFERHLIRYPSDGLRIYGFMNVPLGEGPFPVVVVVHGYVNPLSYRTLAYTTRYADAYAQAGFLVLHPDLRGHGGSDPGLNPFRAGYAVDVLNLIHQLDSLPQADPQRVALWGHSMGGGITIKVLTVTDRVRGAVLYGSMSSDERQNYHRILHFRGGQPPEPSQLPVPPDADPELYSRLSPANYLEK